MQSLLAELKAGYGQRPEYQVLERVFGEHFKLVKAQVQAKVQKELSACSLQSPDDWEATVRQKGNKLYQGYVANLTETCDPENPMQLITKVQVDPNHTDDSILLQAAMPNLMQRTQLKTLYTDGGYGGPEEDRLLAENGVVALQTSLRGGRLNPEKLTLVDFVFECDATGQPLTACCPQGQKVPVELCPQGKGHVAKFDATVCQTCPFQQAGQCPARRRKRKPVSGLNFTLNKLRLTLRRQRSARFMQSKHNLRAAIEATVRAVKHPFPEGKLPVRGRFRISYMLIGSAAMNNVRQIQRHLERLRSKARKEAESQSQDSFCFPFNWLFQALFQPFFALAPH
jgi:hypothetical protein